MSELKKPRKSQFKYAETVERLGDVDLAAKECNVSRESIRRGVRAVQRWESESDVDTTPDAMLQELRKIYSPAEIRSLIRGKKTAQTHHTKVHDFTGDEICIGVITDTHIGSKYTDVSYIDEAFEVFAQEGVDMVVHAGDVTEGMSNRAGHVLECTEIGYQQQRDRAIEVLSQWTETPMYMITGNHDDWFKLSNGACIVQDICHHIDNAVFLGHSEGNIQLGAVQVRLWHGLDGSSYAHSYRIQKIIESFTGGDKPNVLICGHVHKAFYSYDRHVHCVSAGCIQKQSSWMRGKRLPAHTGFFVIRMTINDKGVGTFTPTFYPLYS